MRRTIRVEIDSSTWPKGTKPPRALSKLAGVQSIDVLLALLHTAVWTRPPQVYGFDLSDCWAFMRYGPALAQTPDLRLRPEWSDLSPHHKTILSDDFGVGLPTMLLCRAFKVLEFSDTAYVLNSKFPGRFAVVKKSKSGPSKMPDYVGRTAAGRFVVLECKGTQDTLAYLKKAMVGGVAQKKNLAPAMGTRIRAALVGGVFIPQWKSRSDGVVRFADPDWREFFNAIREMSDDELEQAVVQIAAAKQLALCGAERAANLFSAASLEESRDIRLDPALVARLSRTVTLPATESLVTERRDGSRRQRAQVIEFSTRAEGLAEVLQGYPTVHEAVRRLRQFTRGRRWGHREDGEGYAAIATPYGVELSVHVQPMG